MDYLDYFYNYLKKRDLSLNTIVSYKSDAEQFLDFINKPALSMDKNDIVNFKNYLEENELNVSSINRKLISIKNFLDFLNEEYNASLTINIKQIKMQHQQYLDDLIFKEDFDKLINCAREYKDNRAEAIFQTLYLTGMRVSELLQLEVTDVGKNYLSIKGKGNKYRTVFIPPKLVEVLNEYIKQRIAKGDKLFTGQRGPINRQTVHNIIKKYAKIAGLNINAAHAHNFRHLYCLSLVEKGLSIDVVADLAGHSNINTTRIYTRKTKEQLMMAINEL
ncbi:phage integrase, SAM-like domain protein [Clostridiales bacterium oral taxon 876 str. F0540]|nr:phage integrase, SAM-like domain protein [Clostridiales bacterium oral taxon 876 str. F0540]